MTFLAERRSGSVARAAEGVMYEIIYDSFPTTRTVQETGA